MSSIRIKRRLHKLKDSISELSPFSNIHRYENFNEFFDDVIEELKDLPTDEYITSEEKDFIVFYTSMYLRDFIKNKYKEKK